jgi:hypothetical protein
MLSTTPEVSRSPPMVEGGTLWLATLSAMTTNPAGAGNGDYSSRDEARLRKLLWVVDLAGRAALTS